MNFFKKKEKIPGREEMSDEIREWRVVRNRNGTYFISRSRLKTPGISAVVRNSNGTYLSVEADLKTPGISAYERYSSISADILRYYLGDIDPNDGSHCYVIEVSRACQFSSLEEAIEKIEMIIKEEKKTKR